LGSGKFGTVMMVKHKKTGSLFALKKIPKEMIRSHFMIDQLTLEIKLQSSLNHKNILSIFGVFDDINHLYIVLEYM
jgi:serine/threonine protein kinase